MAPLRDHRTLLEEAAAVRAQASALHQAALGNLGKEHESWGARRDVAMREAGAARHNAVHADKQADELYGKSNAYAEQAGELDAAGARVVDSRPIEAEENFEQAKAWLRHAESFSHRAEDARQAAREWAQKADELEKNAQTIDNEPNPPTFTAPKLKALADQLDDKARLLTEAAEKQVDAAAEDAAGEPGAASASRNWATYALQQADTMQLDYGSLDPQVLRDAGIPLSQIPGSELMRPDAAGSAPGATNAVTPGVDDVSGATQYDDTDLSDPNAAAPPDASDAADAAEVAARPDAEPYRPDDATGDADNTDAYTATYADSSEYGDAGAYGDAGTYDEAGSYADAADVSDYEPSFDA